MNTLQCFYYKILEINIKTVVLSDEEFHKIQYQALQEEYPKMRQQIVDLLNETADLKAEIKQLKWRLHQQD